MVSHMKDMALAIEEEENAENKESVPPPEYELMLKKMAGIEPPPIDQTWLDNISKVIVDIIVFKTNTVQIILTVSECYWKMQWCTWTN